jgi:hypothetical protein
MAVAITVVAMADIIPGVLDPRIVAATIKGRTVAMAVISNR